MAHTDRQRWDRRYATPGEHLKKEPNDVLIRHVPPPRPGARALELACGLGHNALWLAEQGYVVDAIDISLAALHSARAEMNRRGLSGVNFIVADLDHFALPVYAYDLVCVFRFLDRSLFPAIRERVRPGGLVITQTLNVRHLDRSPDCCVDHMLQLGELPRYFPGWTVLEADDGPYMSGIVARKPG
jgi:tellurite methyltransferase